MGVIKALLVGVCDYSELRQHSLPLCKNDLYAVRDALIDGLNVENDNIRLCGEQGKVTFSDLIYSINIVISEMEDKDTFIFYFSGHGGKNSLALSDGLIELQELIDVVEKINIKNKIVILDSCHAGSFSVNTVPKMDITETIESFVGYGYAVLASCGSEQFSGFNDDRQLSLYTSFLCDALTSNSLIKKGRKSLGDINALIFHYSNIWNKKGEGIIQEPIFRSSIGGTIFFDVEDYSEYKAAKIYEETENYIIYEVKPLHNTIKRLSVRVILRTKSPMEKIANISTEIQRKVLHYEVHQNEISEATYRGKAANIVWCYFGYDEDDMVNSNFVCYTTWVDDLQDKDRWYRISNNTVFINNVHISVNKSYEMIKGLKDDTIDKEELILLIREYSSKIISIAEQYIKNYREYLNNTLTEEHLIDIFKPLNREISLWFSKQSELPIPPNELDKWSRVNENISSTIHDFSLFYNEKNLETWDTENRKWLMSEAIKRYEIELEELKAIEKLL